LRIRTPCPSDMALIGKLPRSFLLNYRYRTEFFLRFIQSLSP
jgi:hypothetical protein